MSFLVLHLVDPRSQERNRGTYVHSWTHFDFYGGPVEVEVKIKRAFPDLTLPLKSCAVVPSGLGIAAQIVHRDAIRLALVRPAKIALFPNHTWVEVMEPNTVDGRPVPSSTARPPGSRAPSI